MSSPPPSDRAARGRALLAARTRRVAWLRRATATAILTATATVAPDLTTSQS